MNIHDAIKDDDVSGVIVGGDYGVRGRLFYDGKPQGGNLYAESESVLMGKFIAKKHDLLADCGAAAHAIYPDNSLWEGRIYHD